ncbi:MAG: transglutaminase-like domain-containing protein [bacterium]
MDRRSYRLNKGLALKICVNLIILISWATMMVLLINKEELVKKDNKVKSSFREIIPEDIEVDDWKSIYISDKWAGYAHTTLCPYSEGNRKGYLIDSISYLRFKMFEQLKDIEIHSREVLDTSFRVIKFEAMISGITRVTITGKRLGDHLLVEIGYGKAKHKRIFEAADDFFLENSILSIYRGKGLKVGDSYTLNLFNPLTLTAEPTNIEVIGEEADYLVLKTEFSGLSQKTWINKNGFVVREETANGWVMAQDTKEKIEQYMNDFSGKRVDILNDVAVITERKLEVPRKTGFLKIRISGIDLADFSFDGERQRVIDPEKGIIEIKSVFADEQGALSLPYEGNDLSRFLKPSIWIQSRDPKIVSKTLDIIGDENNSWLAAKKIGKWVHENVNSAFSIGIPIATSVLLNREGDCNEHTVLFVALARSCGIPADICAGFVYINDGFYYHAWPKVYVGKWIHLDPTFGQSIADATHFELVSGDLSAQAKLALTIGKIDMEIIHSEIWRNGYDRDQ